MKNWLIAILAGMLFFSGVFLLFYFKVQLKEQGNTGEVISAEEVQGSPYTIHVPDYYFEGKEQRKVFISSVDPWFGSLEAEQIIIVFASLGPESAEVYGAVKQIEAEHSGETAVFWKDYPADEAAKFKAEEAQCAGQQDKFWEYADQEILGQAKDLGLDQDLFQKCLDSDEMLSLVQNNYYYGRSLGIEEGPVVYIDNELAAGELNYENINNQINYVQEN